MFGKQDSELGDLVAFEVIVQGILGHALPQNVVKQDSE